MATYEDGTEAKVGDVVIGPAIGQLDRNSRDICVVDAVRDGENFNLGIRSILSIIVSGGNKVVITRHAESHCEHNAREWTKLV